METLVADIRAAVHRAIVAKDGAVWLEIDGSIGGGSTVDGLPIGTVLLADDFSGDLAADVREFGDEVIAADLAERLTQLFAANSGE